MAKRRKQLQIRLESKSWGEAIAITKVLGMQNYAERAHHYGVIAEQKNHALIAQLVRAFG